MKERENIDIKRERKKRGKKKDNSVCSGEYLFKKHYWVSPMCQMVLEALRLKNR